MANIISMGYEGMIYYGAPGSSATTLLTNSRDVKITLEPQYGNTTVRGDSTSPPVESVGVSSIKWGATLSMVNKTSDTALTAMLTAATTGAPIALRFKSTTSGKGYDGDVNVKYEQGAPLKGEQTLDFSFEPNRDLRVPVLLV
jgi:hypothetical protein